MSQQPNKITVSRRSDGRYEGKRPDAARASVVADTQREAYEASRAVLGNSGGGELAVRRVRGAGKGQIREQNTIAPGNDPRDRRG